MEMHRKSELFRGLGDGKQRTSSVWFGFLGQVKYNLMRPNAKI